MKASPHTGAKVMMALFTAKPEKRKEFLQTLRFLVDEIRQQPGCQVCMAGQDIGEEPRFVLYLLWKDLASFEAYLASESFRVLIGASSTLSTPAEFRVIAADSTRGGDLAISTPLGLRPA